MPFPEESDFSTDMTVAPVLASDGRHQGGLFRFERPNQYTALSLEGVQVTGFLRMPHSSWRSAFLLCAPTAARTAAA